ncbi:hypothetical protein LAWI1_G001055 [Lachnellula willkommii]|uniref:N-acetyltransferase domain-containing protein n=1 Tax=Lachnellula willkommii TaxID=215461 RepID=A0A559MIJ5_9HELO|nr:hypothetical protein LAWI1_G001055 [Lachnellula willkommii]
MAAKEIVKFYRHLQETALSTFLPILQQHLPHSNPIYNRLQAPHNLPSRHCLFAATFPPPAPGSSASVPEVYTILFSDRSRRAESQVWIFNNLATLPTPLPTSQQNILNTHVHSAIIYLRATEIPEAPGWPFDQRLKFSCLHDSITTSLTQLLETRGGIPYITKWNFWIVPTATVSSKPRRPLPAGYSVSRVPEDQLDIVVSTSAVPREPSTLKGQANVGIMDSDGKLAAWGYLGIDGSLATLYVLPEHRGRGLATQVAVELLSRYERGGFADLGYAGRSGYVHSDVKVGNRESEGVMKSIGAEVRGTSSYLHVDSDRFSGYVHSMVKAGNEGSEGVMKSFGGSIERQGNKVFVDSNKFSMC